jgi:hypothetical protein
MKRVFGFSYKAGDRTSLAYDAKYWLRNVMLPELYMPIHLSGTQRNWNILLLGTVAGSFTSKNGLLP